MSNTALQNQRFAGDLVGALAGGGLRHVVASPGARNAPLLLAVAACPTIALHMVLDERVAGFVALGLARATGRAVGLLCTSGSAAAHYYPAVLEAEASGVPLLVLSANRPPELQDCGAAQTLEQARLFGEHACHFRSLGPADPAFSAAVLAGVSARALDAAERAGGVAHLDVAFREPLYSPDLPPRVVTPCASPRALSARPGFAAWDADLLRGATRGLIVCGPQTADLGRAPRFAAAVQALGEHLGWPILSEPLGHARSGEGCVGPAELLLRDPAFAAAHRPDVVLRFGAWPTSKTLGRWLAQLDAPQVLVEPRGRLLDPAHAVRALVPLEGGAFCEALRAALPPGPRPRVWERSWRGASARLEAQLAPLCADDAGVWEGAVARVVAEALPAGGLLHVAASMPVRDLDCYAPRLAAGAVVASNRGLNGIDGTLSTAWGEALAWEGPTVVLCGDLACLHDAGGLLAARGLGVSATVVVIQNGGGGIFERLPLGDHPQHERLFVTPQTAGLAGLCASAGARHLRVESLPELRAALGEPPCPGVRVLEVPCPRPFNHAQHAAAERRAVEAALEPSCLPR
ncbi:MAG: 2-succinyl-5-enolpyruvyl-6-hydroxy-3-cyclohexene-1-carboxylic-acid synthase [Planctomycetes bacterium]|nr:2-succinyl-5-enolpyruvyl-6-hydroxy-3-cyclohexene-1-carboxylic-acid synthase [Planctomycetota bacterium]